MIRLPQRLARWRGSTDPGRRGRRSSALAIDVQGGWVHLAQAALRGNEPRLVRHLAFPLELPEHASAEDATTVGKFIAQRISGKGFDTGAIVLGVPRSLAILRVLSLPPTKSTGELASMVHFQVGRDLPFRLDETVVDFHPISAPPPTPAKAAEAGATAAEPPPSGSPGNPVLAAVVRREQVARFETLAREAGGRLSALGLRSLATVHAATLCEPEVRHGCVGLVAVQATEISFDVLVDGELVFSRVGALPPASPGHDQALLETVRSIHDYEGIPGHGRIAALHVHGATGMEESLAEALENRFGIPARRLDSKVALDQVEGSRDHAEGCLPAVGLALAALEPGGYPVDFLAPKNPPVPVDNRRLKRLAAVAAVLGVVLGLAGLRSRMIRQREAVRNELQQQVTLAGKNLPGYRSTRAQAKAVTDWMAGSRRWLDHLSVLSALLPPSRELLVTSLSTTPRQSLSLSVRIRSGEIIDRLSSDLRKAGFVVKPPGITPINDRSGYRFQASLEIDAPTVVTNQIESLSVPPRAVPPATPAASAPASDPAKATEARPAPPPSAAPPGVAPKPYSALTPEERAARRSRRRPEGGPRE